jgi:phospholipase C
MTMENIEHVVVLMLENRPFDGMLGWLYESDQPNVVVPKPSDSNDLFRGLQDVDLNSFTNTANGGRISSPPVRGASGYTVPTTDPGEEFEHVNVKFFDTANPGPHTEVTMKGVLQDYVDVMTKLGDYNEAEIEARSPMIMQSYTPSQLPVLNQLAKHYAVSDDWFASVPSQTNPNRAFAMCGTSHGLVNNGELEQNHWAKELKRILGVSIGDDIFPDTTIFNAMDVGDWNVFWQTSYLPHKIATLIDDAEAIQPFLPAFGSLGIALDALIEALRPLENYIKGLASDELGSCYTWRLFHRIREIPQAEQYFRKIDDFHCMARAGTLPKFSYIEPFWTIAGSTVDGGLKKAVTALGNDYHPPSNLIVGENFVKEVYSSLISNPDAWAKTLLVITFDEFLGGFDHVTPPATVPPWGKDGQPKFKSPTHFDFKRLGARVPAILVSPWVAKKTVFRSEDTVPFDHSSIISTTLNWLGKADLIPEFQARAVQAPKFDNALTLTEPRTDAQDIDFLKTARKIGDPVGYGDQLVLRNQNGKYVGASVNQSKHGDLIPTAILGLATDLELAAYFPTMGDAASKVPLVFLGRGIKHAAEVQDGDAVWLVTTETSVGARNFLGAGSWSDSPDCYYDLSYLDEGFEANQTWVVQKVGTAGGALHYGDEVYLVNRHFADQRLSQDNGVTSDRWVTTIKDGDSWTIEPAKERQVG